ncbi:glycosyltransferase [Microvirga lenta]|uniref:glycosyltransferase n=1 Tax=Microvirga lenta TaxID=2881337 RepID=UPI0021F62069|nr:glycosyltransferase [Microvirga lenta]
MSGYRGEDVLDLMSSCDFIVVPSVWWENSPVVIQEARLAGRPLICSNIGGMSEKVDLSVDHVFPARSPGALANLNAGIATGQISPDQAHSATLAEARAERDNRHFAQYRTLYQTV